MRISTIRGETPVQELFRGTLVRTLAGNYAPIVEVMRETLPSERLRSTPNLIPVLIRRGALGPELPKRDLYVTGSQEFEPKHQVRMAHLMRNSVARLPDSGEVEFTVFRLEEPSPVRCEGLWVLKTPAARSFADIRTKPEMKPRGR